MQTMSPDSAGKIRLAERILLAIGLTLLVVWVAARLHGSIASDAAMKRFHADTLENYGSSTNTADVDFTQWSPKRIVAYKDSLAAKKDLPLAILHIPKINLD